MRATTTKTTSRRMITRNLRWLFRSFERDRGSSGRAARLSSRFACSRGGSREAAAPVRCGRSLLPVHIKPLQLFLGQEMILEVGRYGGEPVSDQCLLAFVQLIGVNVCPRKVPRLDVCSFVFQQAGSIIPSALQTRRPVSCLRIFDNQHPVRAVRR
jgi:hypothetical protein